VSAEVSKTSLKFMSGSSVVEKIANCLLSYMVFRYLDVTGLESIIVLLDFCCCECSVVYGGV
jgi:hypothetical protein